MSHLTSPIGRRVTLLLLVTSSSTAFILCLKAVDPPPDLLQPRVRPSSTFFRYSSTAAKDGSSASICACVVA